MVNFIAEIGINHNGSMELCKDMIMLCKSLGVKYVKIQKTDNNLLIFKCEMDAGHSGKSGRTSAIEEVAFDYAFALKISEKLDI